MATKKELEELGKKFIDLEIEVLNQTNTSIFENGIYNNEFLKIPEWEKGIKEFLMFDSYTNVSHKEVRYFYQSLAELVNKAYIRYKDCLSSVDRLNLKVYLQISEILDQEQKIYDMERYQSSKKVIEAQEHLNNIVLSSYKNQLNMIEKAMSDNKFKESLEKVLKNKEQEEVKESFTDGEWKTFEYLYNLIKPENKEKLEAEIKEAQESIKEAQRRQASYDKQKKSNEIKRIVNDNANLEELKQNKNAASNFFNNKQAVESTIKVLENCLDYYYTLMFLNEFMNCLSVMEIQNQFYFMKPLELMSYSKLEGGLDDLLAVLDHKDIHIMDFNTVAYKYISLELFNNDKVNTSSSVVKEARKECNKIMYELRSSLCNALELKNRKNAIQDIIKIEQDFIKALKEEKGW